MERAEILDEFRALPEHRRLQALAIAARDALEVWRAFRAGGEPLDYYDGVVGGHHVVDDELPERALGAVELALAGRDWDHAIAHTYQEPIVALQDDDLEFPDKIEYAYYAIYNLFQIATKQPHHAEEQVVMSQVASAIDSELDDWLREWRTRTWDAWASQPEPAYVASCDAAVLAALARGDVVAAVDLASGLARAVVLAIAGRRADAIECAVGAVAADEPAIREWLADHVGALAPDAVALDPGGTRFAVIAGDELVIRERSGARIHGTQFRGSVLRRVRFADPDTVWVAGERIDAIGAWATFWDAVVLANDDGELARGQVPGLRAIAALGSGVVIPVDDRELVVFGAARDTFAGVAVHVAAIDDQNRVIVTGDDTALSIWQRDAGTRETLPGEAQQLVIGGNRVLAIWRGGGASLLSL